MRKKGFTLIETLAVIIILAILSLILTPMIQDIIKSSRKKHIFIFNTDILMKKIKVK